MTTILQGISEMTEGAKQVASSDPYGLTLTVVSVLVVFCALLILYVIYSLTGKLFSGELQVKAGRQPEDRLDDKYDDGTEAAIATALHLYFTENLHDRESYVVTIDESRLSGGWGSPVQNFRKKPAR